ncbi:MAG TPA: hypothetical protein VNM22_13105 [Candidatus Limnocylindrales bacterium]|nr:hypothetical protein [Candidatus Limnocylindrales bacterium]
MGVREYGGMEGWVCKRIYPHTPLLPHLLFMDEDLKTAKVSLKPKLLTEQDVLKIRIERR